MNEKTIIAGTYTDTGSKGIYSFTMTDGILSAPKVFAETDSPKYVDVSDGLVASIAKYSKGCGVTVFDGQGTPLARKSFEDGTACWVGWHGKEIYTANYHAGTFAKLSWEDGELKKERVVTIQEKAGCHQVLFHEDRILVPCLFLDRIMIFDHDMNYQGAIIFPDGTGPRHGVFSADGSALYMISELSNELFVLDTSDWGVRAVLPVLPDGETHVRGGAAVRLGEDQKHLYVSTRRKDVISVIDLERMKVIQGAYSGGKFPRDFILADQYLISANRYSDTIVCFRLNEDGTIGGETSRINVPQAVSLAVL